jgi:hypothetical protein
MKIICNQDEKDSLSHIFKNHCPFQHMKNPVICKHNINCDECMGKHITYEIVSTLDQNTSITINIVNPMYNEYCTESEIEENWLAYNIDDYFTYDEYKQLLIRRGIKICTEKIDMSSINLDVGDISVCDVNEFIRQIATIFPSENEIDDEEYMKHM